MGDAFRDTGDNMQAQMTLTDWLVEQPEVDSEQIAILGISFGGIRSSFLMGIDERLKKAVLVVSGGGLADIMASSQLADVVKIRDKHMQEEQIQVLESTKRSSKMLKSYNVGFLCRRDSEEFLLFLDKKDSSVPTNTQEALKLKLGNPKTYGVAMVTSVLQLTLALEE